jgi:dUTPase
MARYNLSVKYKLLSPKAELPKRANSTDSGYDLKVLGVEKIEGDVIFFKTGVSVQPPKGYYFEIFPRSSISKLPISLANSVAVIDEGYTGEILVAARVHHHDMGGETKRNSYPNGIVSCFGVKPQSIQSFAELIVANKPVFSQLVLKKRFEFDFVSEELQETERGDGGFGSTDSQITE